MPEQMSASKQAQFVKSMELQGVIVLRTTKGFFLRLPNGESTVAHFTNSDVRAQKNLIGILRKAGVRHPEDPKNVAELPPSITDAPPVAKRTIQTVTQYVKDHDFPGSIKVSDLVDSTGIAHITATKAMYQMGFKPTRGKHNARDWLTPDSIMALKPDPVVVEEMGQIVDDAESPTFQEAMEPTRDEKEVHRLKSLGQPFHDNSVEREFIDTHDSWTVDLDRVSQYARVHEYIDSLRSAGLEVEIRVWKA